MDKLATHLPYTKVSFKVSNNLPLPPEGMTVYKYFGIIWGILVNSFMDANSFEENNCTEAVGRQKKSQPIASEYRPSPQGSMVPMSLPAFLFCGGQAMHHHWMSRRPQSRMLSLRCSWEAEKEISLSVFLTCQNISQFHLFLGLAFLSSLHGGLLLQHGVSRSVESFPTLHGASLFCCLFLHETRGLSHNYGIDGPLA